MFLSEVNLQNLYFRKQKVKVKVFLKLIGIFECLEMR